MTRTKSFYAQPSKSIIQFPIPSHITTIILQKSSAGPEASSFAIYIEGYFKYTILSRTARTTVVMGREQKRWQRRSWRLAGFFAVSLASKRGLTTALSQKPNKIAVIGGGASGMFASIAAAEHAEFAKAPTQVVVLEATSKTLSKVKISGGGRCKRC